MTDDTPEDTPQPRLATVTESQFAPGLAAAQEGDVWIRTSAGGIRQRYELMTDKLDGQAAALGWVGYMPQGGALGLHMSKFAAANFHTQWVHAMQGLAVQVNIENPLATWTITHNLGYRLLDITCIRAQDDWSYNPGTLLWTDPQAATRPVTIMIPRVRLATANATALEFAEPVRGIALVRR